MILIITHKEDFTADFMIHKLNQRSVPYKRLNCEDLFTSDYKIQFDPAFSYQILGEDQFRSVWFRRTRLPEIKGLTKAEQFYLLGETDSFFNNLFSSLPANWVSAPESVYRAENKMLQLKVASGIGFQIPKTLVTNSRTALQTFYEDCRKKIIVKPLSQSRINYPVQQAYIFTNPVTPEVMSNLEQYDLTPCIYQEQVDKDYELRITVVGGDIFPAAVYSQTDEETRNDWRRKQLFFHRTSIPEAIEEQCIQLLKHLNLQFGAIDMIKTPAGEYVFLEINPNGQWAWIETQTGLPIADAIIEQLHQYIP